MDARLLRVADICNDPRKKTRGILNICKANWWRGVREKRYPAGFMLSARVHVWSATEIDALLERLKAEGER